MKTQGVYPCWFQLTNGFFLDNATHQALIPTDQVLISRKRKAMIALSSCSINIAG